MSNERFIVTKTDEIYGTPVISEDDTNLRIVTSSATTSAPEFVVTKTDEIYGTPVITEDDTNLRIVTSSATTSAPEFVATKTDGIDGSPAITEDDTNLLIVTSSATASAPQFVAQKNSSYVGPSTDLKSASVDLQYASFYSHTESFISTSEIDHKPSIPKLQKQQFEGELENPCCALFEEEIDERPRVATVLNTITNYSMMSQNVTKQDSEVRKVETVPSAKLGTIMGVYLPCVQNILGVILFVRMTWIVGLAGIIEGFFIVFLCVCTTLNTSISMSAIATNGVVPAGGAYFMISRALGPEFGGAVGLLFYLGTTYASSLYILGAVEILLTYMAPELSLFGDFRGPENRGALFNNYRVYGSIFLVLMTVLVFVGVKLVNKFASLFLACVIISIISIWGGIIKSAFSPPDISICFLGNRLLRQLQGDKICAKFAFNSTTNTTERTSLYRQHCSLQNDAWICDPFFEANDLKEDLAVPGLGHVMDNVYSTYLEKEAPISTAMFSSVEASSNYASPPWVVADLTSSFTVLLAIFFPSVTGIMAGSNRSGDLADGQRSIPRGTIGAVLTTGCIYLCSVVLFGLCIHGAVLRDKFGESIGDELIVSIVSWPNKWVVLVGAFLSTIGAGLQSLTGAPRLLQAIAKDNIIPILQVFGSGKQNGEPTWALLLTFFISCSGILIANLDLVAPILTMFFLMCYMFVNLACALHSLLDTPNWRPRYNYYHWFLSLIGVCLCITLMFISSWYYALAALAVAGIIYKYIEYSGAEKEWGDGLRGLKLTTARFALLRVGSGQPHTKNWRPQLLVLLKLDARLAPKNPGVLAFVAQLKAGKGLIVVASVLEGDSCEKYLDAKTAEQNLAKEMDFYKIKGFEQVLVSRSIEDGVSALIQTAGLGGLSPNTIVLGWPYDKHFKGGRRSYSAFLRAVRQASTQQKAILVPKYIEKFPIRPDQIMTSTIDVWWIVHDGGLLMLLPFLLTQHKTWKSCIIRIFTVAQLEDNSVQIKKDLELFLYQLRIEAKVSVIEMQDSDISAYTYERTLRMEQRTEILNKLHMSKRDSQKDVADVIERSRHNYFLNKVHPIEKSPLDEYSEEETETRDEKPVEVTQRTWTKQKNALICIKESGTESLSDSVEPDPFRLKPLKST